MFTSFNPVVPAATPVPVVPGNSEAALPATEVLDKDTPPNGSCSVPLEELVQQLATDRKFCREMLRIFNEGPAAR